MAGTFLKWLIPAVVTVVGGTALALAQTDSTITADLSSRTAAALAADFDWAHPTVEGRDVLLTGVATSQQLIDGAIARVAAIPGVGSVTADATLAESVRPFPFSATIADGVTELDGGYPTEAIHKRLLADAGPADDKTRLLSGVPDAATFEGGARFGLAALKNLDEGSASLSDQSLTISGRAKSPEAFDMLQALPAAVPPGITLASLVISPPLARPYLWTASFDGTRISITGNTPTADLADELKSAVPANIPVTINLVRASGEPAAFAANALTLLKSLLLLENGEANIKDSAIDLSGAPATAAIANKVTADIAAIGGTTALEPPGVADFGFSIVKAGGKMSFAGFVPDKATRDRLAGLASADVSALALGRGAPQGFADALKLGLSVMGLLADGQFNLKGDHVGLGGHAATLRDFKAASDLVAGASAGTITFTAELQPPVANPFVFAAEKSATGTSLTGFVPDEAARTAIHAKITGPVADAAEPAAGAPDNFETSVAKGLEVLALLDTGTLKFDGAAWSLEGTVDSAQKGFAADAAYSVAGLRTAGWTYNVHAPAAPQLPTVVPYVWKAAKDPAGAITITGYAPSTDFQALVKTKAPTATDTTALGGGAPADFEKNASAGLVALAALSEGAVSFDGTVWSLTGSAASGAARDSVQSALGSEINAAAWRITIQIPQAAPVVTPYLWSAIKSAEGSVDFAGYLPSEPLKAATAARVAKLGHDTTAIASGEPEGFEADVAAGLDALGHLNAGRVAFDGSKWTLAGSAATPADADAAVASLSKGSKGGALWTHELTGPQPESSASQASSSSEASSAPDITSIAPPSSAVSSLESASSSEPPSSGPPASSEPSSSEPSAPSLAPSSEPAPSAALEMCRDSVKAIADKNAILFKAGGATLMPSSLPVLDELASDLKACPATFVHVQGHTDADGDADANLTLSVSRAEAVVAALVERGIDESRLYAEGFGESDPIAPNDTKAGKAQNRRIAFDITAE